MNEFTFEDTTSSSDNAPAGWTEYHVKRDGEYTYHWLIKRKRENSRRCEYYHYARSTHYIPDYKDPFQEILGASTKLAATNERDARALVLALARMD